MLPASSSIELFLLFPTIEVRRSSKTKQKNKGNTVKILNAKKGLTVARMIPIEPKLFLSMICLMQLRSLESTITQNAYKPRL